MQHLQQSQKLDTGSTSTYYSIKLNKKNITIMEVQPPKGQTS